LLNQELSDNAAARAAAERELNKKIAHLEQDAVSRLQTQRQEHEQEMQVQKESHKKYEEELRKTFAKREQEMLLKVEELRLVLSRSEAEWHKLKEDMHKDHVANTDVLKKEFQKRLNETEAEHKRNLEQVQQGHVDAALLDLQAQLCHKAQSLLEEHSAANSLKTEVDRLKEREASLVSQLDQSKIEISELQNACKDAESKFEQVKNSLVPVKALEDVRSQRDDLTHRLSEITALLQDSQKRQQTLMEQIEKTSADLELLKRRENELQDTLSQKERQLQDIVNQKQSLASQLNSATCMLQQRGDDFSDLTGQLEHRLIESSQQIDQLRTTLLTEQEAKVKLSAELQEINILVKDYSNQIAESTNNINLVQDRLALAEVDRHRDKEQFVKVKLALDEALAEKEAFITTLEKSLSDATQALAKKEATMTLLESSLSDATQRAADAKSEVSDLARALRDTEARVHEKSGLQSESDSITSALHMRVQSVEAENSTLTEEMDKVLQENAELRQQLDDAQNEVDDLKLQNQQVKTQYNELDTQINDLRTEHALVHLVGHPESPALVYTQPEASIKIAPLRATRVAPPSTSSFAHSRQNPTTEFMGDSRRTSGVHGLRLIRTMFDDWITRCLDRRMLGIKTGFTGLDFLTNQVLTTHISECAHVGSADPCVFSSKCQPFEGIVQPRR
jgi:predicted  nucleic acid-binding Zn-ribbon protein